MAKVEVPGLAPPAPPKEPPPAPAEPPPEPEPEPEPREAPGEPIEGGLDPVLAQAVASQPEVPTPEHAGDLAPTPSPPADRSPAAGSAPPTVSRHRAPGGLLAAGALALAGAFLTVALGGRHGKITHPKPTGTAAGAGNAGSAFTGPGDGFFDPAERELARRFGLG